MYMIINIASTIIPPQLCIPLSPTHSVLYMTIIYHDDACLSVCSVLVGYLGAMHLLVFVTLYYVAHQHGGGCDYSSASGASPHS
jgi:hypothetical protein